MTKVTPIVALAIAMLAVPSFASPTSHKAKSHVKAAAIYCPVSGERIDSIKDAFGHSTYKGKTYYFCCPQCKPLFDKDPEKYIKAGAKKSSMNM